MDHAGKCFRVQLANGEIKKFSLDELDAAYRQSLIDEESFVLREGHSQWMKIGELLAEADTVETPSMSNTAQSLAPPPVVTDLTADEAAGDLDIDVEIDEASFLPRRSRGGLWFAGAAVLVLGAGGALFAVKGKELLKRYAAPVAAVVAPVHEQQHSPAAAPPAAAPPAAAPVAPAPAAETPVVPVAAKSEAEPSTPKAHAGKAAKGKGKKAGTKKARPASPKKKKKAKRSDSPFTGM